MSCSQNKSDTQSTGPLCENFLNSFLISLLEKCLDEKKRSIAFDCFCQVLHIYATYVAGKQHPEKPSERATIPVPLSNEICSFCQSITIPLPQEDRKHFLLLRGLMMTFKKKIAFQEVRGMRKVNVIGDRDSAHRANVHVASEKR